MSQFLDNNGLTFLWGKIKDKVDSARALMVTGTITAVDPETYMPTAISVDKTAQDCRDAATAGNEVYLYIPMGTNAIVLQLVTWGPAGVTFSTIAPNRIDGTNDGILGIIGTVVIWDDETVSLDIKEIPDIDISDYYTSAQTDTLLSGKQDTISDLSTIRNLANGSVQKAPTIISSTDLNTVKTTGIYTTTNCSNGYFSGTTLLQVISGTPYSTVQVQYPVLSITSAASAFRICYALNSTWTPWMEMSAPQEDSLIVRFYWSTEEEEPEPEDYELTCDKTFLEIGTAFYEGKKIYGIYDGSALQEDICVNSNVVSDGQTAITFYFTAGSGFKTEVITIDSTDTLTQSTNYTENMANKVTSLSSSSTDTQYPSAKAVYDAIQAGGGGSGIFYVTFTASIDSGTGDMVVTSDKTFVEIGGALLGGQTVIGIFNSVAIGMGYLFTSLVSTDATTFIGFAINFGTTSWMLSIDNTDSITVTQKGLAQADEVEYKSYKVTTIESISSGFDDNITYPSAKAVYTLVDPAERKAKRIFGEGHYTSITYDGSNDETWNVNTALTVRDVLRYRFVGPGFTKPSIFYSADTNFCFVDGSEYILVTDGNAGKKSSGIGLVESGANLVPYVYMHPNNPITTVADFRAWLAANPITIYYPN